MHPTFLSIRRAGVPAALLLVAGIAAVLRFWQLGSLPPGLHYDEAFNNLHALRLSRGQAISFYVQDEYGEEPMHILLTALLFRLAGPTPLGGRIVSAASGVVTVLGLYFLGVELFQVYGAGPARRIALLGSLFLATWYWSFHYNRIGMEPSMVPMTAVFAMLFLWRALRTGQLPDAALAGASVALSLYTYPAGRAVPLAAGLAVLRHHALGHRPARVSPTRLASYGLMIAAGVLVFAPLGLTFLRNPEWFFLRMRQTTAATFAGDSPAAALLQGAWQTLLGFFWRGDQNWRQNLPGRPMFDAIQGLFLLVGAGACLRRAKDSPYWFLPVWAVLGLLPTMLTEYAPHFGRALGATPPLALITGLGMWSMGRWIMKGRWLIRFLPFPGRAALAAACLGGALAYSSGLAINDYFNRWARSPGLFAAFDVGLRRIGEYAARLPPQEPIYISPVGGDWYTLAYAMGDAGWRLRAFNGRECLVFPARTERVTHEIIIVSPTEDPRSLPRLEAIFPAGSRVWQVNNRDAVYAVDYAVPAGQTALVQPRHPIRASLGNGISLLGYDLDTTVARPGESLTVRLWWQALNEMSVDYTTFVHLIGPPHPDTGSVVWAQRDAQPCNHSYRTTRWTPGEVVWDDYTLVLPADMPAGIFALQIGMYDLATGQRLPIQSRDGPPGIDALPLAPIEIHAP